MTKPFRGVINVDVTQSVPDWEPYTQPIAPEGTPNVLYIVLDDVGYSAMEPYGGLIETPNINRITQRGLTYTNFHTTALCSPTRSCLMTGRNHTTNGMATITEAASGFPSSNGHIPFECATIAEVLGERGWNTYVTGKWHLTAEDEMNMASRRPSGRSGGASSGSTASSARRPTSGTRTWSITTFRSSRRSRRRRATT
jgi:arylsulfatase